MKVLKVGQRRTWESKAYRGSGVIEEIRQTQKGLYVVLATKGHPRGRVAVRESQVK